MAWNALTLTFAVVAGLLATPFAAAAVGGVAPLGGPAGHPASVPSPLVKILKTLSVGTQPTGATYDPVNGKLYEPNLGSNSVSIIRGSTNKVIHNVSVGVRPVHVVFNNASHDLYVLNLGSNNVSVISGLKDKVVRTVNISGNLLPISTYDPADGDVYVVSQISAPANDRVTQIDKVTYGLRTFAIGPASQIVFDPGNQELVTTNTATNNLSLIAPNATAATTINLPAGSGPATFTYNPFNLDLYISDPGNSVHGAPAPTGNVTVLAKNNSIVATIKVGQLPVVSTYDPANHDIYMVNQGYLGLGGTPNSSVSVIAPSNTVVRTIPLGPGGVLATFDPKNNEMFVACALANKTYVINTTTNKVVAKLTTLDHPFGSIYDPRSSDVFVIPYGGVGSTLLTALSSSNKVVSTLALGSGPTGPVFDPANGDMYIANQGSGNISVVR
jgi:YVTN family beta-propeller protein